VSVRSPKRHGLALLAAAMLLVSWAVDAGAISGVRFNPGGSITQTGTFRVIGSGEERVECPITLSGSFATTLVTVGETQPSVGSHTGLTSGTCTRGSIRTVLSLPSTFTLQSPTRTAPAGSISTMELRSNVGIRVLFSGGFECLLPRLIEGVSLEAIGNNEYVLERAPFVTSVECGAFGPFAWFELNAPSPRQVATFLTGNEVIDGFTPRPVVFGTVSPGALDQETVTIGSSAGGRIEEIVVTSQRYFAITDPNGCRGRVLEARGTCNINVLLSAPTESGRTVTDTLTVRIAERRFEGQLRAST
jgi:hypothetical protein